MYGSKYANSAEPMGVHALVRVPSRSDPGAPRISPCTWIMKSWVGETACSAG